MRPLVNIAEIMELMKKVSLGSNDEQNNLKEHTDCMKEGQNDIYCIAGQSIIPVCLNFIEAIADSENPSLYKSREIMQQNKLLYVDKRNRATKPIAMLAETADEKDMYKKFYGQFAECSKPETHESFVSDQGATEQDGYDT